MTRTATRTRKTKETEISIEVAIDGTGRSHASTGLPFFDNMLAQLGKHAQFDLTIDAKGDLEIDAHHTVEDVGILLGELVRTAMPSETSWAQEICGRGIQLMIGLPSAPSSGLRSGPSLGKPISIKHILQLPGELSFLW